ncbi:uncharacterized protein C8Q71DRAFT_408741 [Rhodofomes roseus]|uniref:Secreted protein n=1 Tax=Rhodofomes roseus TaxID=34475 RepID=A0ABQ8JYQ8_9APHY|nr:uncharacterized protein C8Q71DRAFT_408741 [Rhodofomes roseus]KAH9829365.1 hypothetical protein C8Q71DRAFT_408741 [Rhodofomes roseus]
MRRSPLVLLRLSSGLHSVHAAYRATSLRSTGSPVYKTILLRSLAPTYFFPSIPFNRVYWVVRAQAYHTPQLHPEVTDNRPVSTLHHGRRSSFLLLITFITHIATEMRSYTLLSLALAAATAAPALGYPFFSQCSRRSPVRARVRGRPLDPRRAKRTHPSLRLSAYGQQSQADAQEEKISQSVSCIGFDVVRLFVRHPRRRFCLRLPLARLRRSPCMRSGWCIAVAVIFPSARSTCAGAATPKAQTGAGVGALVAPAPAYPEGTEELVGDTSGLDVVL